MKYLRKFDKFIESSDVAEPVKKTANVTKPTKKALKHKGPEATLEDVVNRVMRVSDNDLKKLIEG